MDLFVVNRYLGEDNKESKVADEKSKLATLLSKIEERRKKKLAALKDKDVASLSDESDVSAEEEDEENIEEEEDKEIVQEEENQEEGLEDGHVEKDSGTTRSKKRKRKEVVDEESENEALPGNEKKDITQTEGFSIIGVHKFKKKEKVKRVLPNWLSNPSVVSVDLQQLTTTINDIPGLDKDLIQALEHNNVTHFFPVQAQVIPWILKANSNPRQYWPHDICVSAPTGSGKTLAYVLPIVQALLHRMVVHVRVLVVLPVHELAVQVHNVFVTYTKCTDVRVALVSGRTSFQKEQMKLVGYGDVHGHHSLVDIIVATPGRLVEHLLHTPGFSLKHLRFLVIDEADRVIDDMQNDWLYFVYKHINSDSKASSHAPALTISNLESTLNPPPQKLLFSATLTQDPEKLEQFHLFQPKLFSSIVGDNETDTETRSTFIGKYTTPTELTEKMCVVRPEIKPLVLYHLISTNNWKRVLVFVGSRQDGRNLSLLLNRLGEGKLKVAHNAYTLGRYDRNTMLKMFASGKLNVLVSSDAFARGMDIDGIDCVVLYNAAKNVKGYIHRVGRTGRAGQPGTAITLLEAGKVNYFNKMLQVAGKDALQNLVVEESDLEVMEEAYRVALEELKFSVQKRARVKNKSIKSMRLHRRRKVKMQGKRSKEVEK